MLRIGIVGQPGCGKTALFKALAPSAAVEVGAGGKREVHIGQARVPDPRLDELNRVFQRPKQVNAVVEYVDVVGFSRGEASRSGYEAQFLGDGDDNQMVGHDSSIHQTCQVSRTCQVWSLFAQVYHVLADLSRANSRIQQQRRPNRLGRLCLFVVPSSL